jgi:hypothetical protein
VKVLDKIEKFAQRLMELWNRYAIKKIAQVLMALLYVAVITAVLLLVQFSPEELSNHGSGNLIRMGLRTGAYLISLYLGLRVITSELSTNDKFFCNVKLGRIRSMTKVMNGKIVRYFSHLSGLTGELENPDDPKNPYRGLVHMDESTGEILPGKEVIFSFWWIFFGVRFIGFNSMKEYIIKKKVRDADGKLVEKKFPAKSLHFSDTYYYQIDDQETRDGIRADLTTAITLQTVHAGESMKYNDWLDTVNPSVLGMSREYVRGKTTKQVLDDKNELSDSKTSYIGCMRQLNNSKVGNISLGIKAGQRVIAASIEQAAFDDKVAKAMEARTVAEAEGDAIIAKEKKLAEAQKEKALGIKAIGDVENEILERRAQILEGSGGQGAVRIKVSENVSEAIKGFQGNGLVLGGAMMNTMGIDDDGGGEKGKKTT